MKATLEIYVQDGTYGKHASSRGAGRTYSVHKTDERTAAWRAAMAHWFERRDNGVLLYEEAHAVRIDKTGEHEYLATLEIPDAEVAAIKFNKSVQAEFQQWNADTLRAKTKNTRELGQSRRRRLNPKVPAKRKPAKRKGRK